MNGSSIFSSFARTVLLAGAIAGPVVGRGADAAIGWRIGSPEPRLVVVQADLTPAERADSFGFWRLVRDVKPWWAWKKEAGFAQRGRADRERALRDPAKWRVAGPGVKRLGFWKSPVGQARFADRAGRLAPTYGAEVVCHVFLELTRALADGERIEVTTPFGNRLTCVRDPAAPSPFLKVNQVGYHPSAPRRYAYLGGWLGTLGAWEPPTEATTFEAVEAETGRVVLRGSCEPRPADTVAKTGVPWTGEKTFGLDLSSLTAGTYCVRVPGVGRSADFKVTTDGIRTALAAHLHGLFVQRCGCGEKKEPRTAWGDAACHLQVWRGTFPPDELDYGGKPGPGGTFTDFAGRPVKVNHFELIELNTDWSRAAESFPGGWHDAADYDRRPSHLSIVTDLAAIALVRRGEASRALLDEAAWGLEHLRRAQTPDGGVGTWIETTRHPREGEGMPSADRLRYVLSRPTRASTLAFAAAASELARCTPELRERYLEPARRAWRWAHETPPATNVAFAARLAGDIRRIYWNETAALSARDELKTAVNLAALGEDEILAGLLTPDFHARFAQEIRAVGWRWSPLVLTELVRSDDPQLQPYRATWTNWLVNRAKRHLAAIEEQPYRLPRGNGTDLGWGNAHPLVIARVLVAAHLATGDPSYLAACHLAQDYHCGCNPDGMTLTSGLGRVCPVRFLSLQSAADGIDEYVAGITPYRWTFGVGAADRALVHTAEEERLWPIWRRRVNLEALSVGCSEYTVHETIGPAVAVTAYLADEGDLAANGLPPSPRPRGRIEDQPGYWALP